MSQPCVYLVRHAEFGDGTYGDHGLNDRGREQARALARRLTDIPLARGLSSPLRRARETAELLLEGRDVPLEIRRCLAEGADGDLAGLDRAVARERYPEDLARGPSVVARLAATGRTAPGGETRDAFLQRARQTRSLIETALEASEATLIVSHGGLMNYALQLLMGISPRDDVPFGFDPCGTVKILSYTEPPTFGPFPMLRFSPL
jgi:probable phosphoglycerate mutase